MFGLCPFEIFEFQHAVTYFEALGNIRYSKYSHSLNWFKLYINLIKDNIFTKNCEEYKNLQSFKKIETNDESFKKACYTYFDFICNNEIDNDQLYKFFNIPLDIYNQMFDEEEKHNMIRNHIRFDSFKCYKCKHFYEKISCVGNDGVEISLEGVRRLYSKDNRIIKNMFYISKFMYCRKREELVKELMASDTYPYNREKRTNDALEKHGESKYFLYKKDDKGEYEHHWTLTPLSYDRTCKHYEEDKEMNSNKFVEKYLDI